MEDALKGLLSAGDATKRPQSRWRQAEMMTEDAKFALGF